MKSQMRHDSNGSVFPPFQNPFQAFLGNLDSMPSAFAPAKTLARAQLEVLGFVNRRAQAYLEIPSRLSQCRTPQDLINEQSRFWNATFQEYAEASRRVMGAWGQLAQPAFSAAKFRSDSAPRHDYITFPEQKPAAPKSSEGDVTPEARRVA